jgi:hypothetical protein
MTSPDLQIRPTWYIVDLVPNLRKLKPEHICYVFMSYSWDSKLASELQNAFRWFSKCWYRLRSHRTVRNETSVDANPDLCASIDNMAPSWPSHVPCVGI